MNIEPPSSRPREISVAEPVTPAYERVKLMLFQPFDLAKWFVIGFCAWLAGLGESGGGFNGGYNAAGGNHSNGNGNPAEQLHHAFHHGKDFVMANLYWIVPVAVVVVTILFCLWVLIIWLSSHGKFMFLHCVALNRAEISEPWTKYWRAGNSLFWFRLVVGLVAMILMLPLVVVLVVAVEELALHDNLLFPISMMMAVGLGMALFSMGIFFIILHKFMVDFVVPIMYLRGNGCLAAWREFLGLLWARPGHFILYILFQIVLSVAIGVLVLAAVLVTCCIAGCLMILPYIGTVVLLPVLIFKRAYPLYYLAQFGSQYDVFPKPPLPPLVPAATV